MLFLIISKYNIFFCGGQTPLWGRGIPLRPPCIYFFDKKFGFVWGRGYISLPLYPTRYLYICHIPCLYILIFGYVCHTCSSYLSHLPVLPTCSLYPIRLLPFPPYPIYLPVPPTLSLYLECFCYNGVRNNVFRF